MTDVGGIAGVEVWLPVLGYEGLYEASNLGLIRSLDRVIRQTNRWGEFDRVYRGRLLVPCTFTGGYLGVTLSKDNVARSRLVHALVLEAFVGRCPEGQQARHNDGKKENCALQNLCYGTPLQNAWDRVRHGTQVRGESDASAKLTDAAVREIRLESRLPLKHHAEKFGVSISAISDVRLGKTWLHVKECVNV